MAASSILIDAANAEAVVAFTRHAVTSNFSQSASLRGETFQPLLRTHFLSLKNKDGAGGGLAVGGGLPAE